MIAIFGSELSDFTKLFNKVNIIKQELFGNGIFMLAKLDGYQILLVVTGYCKVNIGISVGYAINRFSPSIIIAIGSCGVISSTIHPIFLGDVAVISNTIQYDIDFSAIGYAIGVVPGIELNSLCCDQHLVEIAICVSKDLRIGCCVGSIASGEHFISSNTHKRLLLKNKSVSFVDMECGAINHAAYIFNIPTIFIKGVADFADNDAATDYERHYTRANANANEVAYQIIRKLLN